MKLMVENVNAENFVDFGEIVTPGGREPTATLEGMEYWADLAKLPNLGKDFGLGYATQAERPTVQRVMERHMNTPELLLPMGGDMVIVVGPPDYPDEAARLPEMGRFKAFRVPEGVAVLFKPGVWHHAPYSLEGTVRLFVVYVAGTSDTDATVVDFTPEQYLEFDLPSK